MYFTQTTNFVTDIVFSKSDFEIANGTTKDKFLLGQGITEKSLVKNLGLLAISFVIMVALFLIYFLMINCFKKLDETLKKKLVYSASINF